MVSIKRHGVIVAELLFSTTGLFLLIYCNQDAREAVSHGINICLQTVIPSLFPFMVLTRWIMGTNMPRSVATIIGRYMKPLFGQPRNSSICLILGLLGGYPIGAQSVAMLYENGDITKQEAERLLGFCNNAGPAFVFGVLGSILGGFSVALTLYFIHILSAILTGTILKLKVNYSTERREPAYQAKHEGCVVSSMKSIGIVCSYVLLFQILIFIAERHTDLPILARVCLSGILELSTGCISLTSLESVYWRYCLASIFLSFGGICVWAQTRTVISGSGLHGRYYLIGKIVQTALAVFITQCLIILFPQLLPLDQSALYLPNHQGLFQTMLWVVGTFFIIFMVWCIILRKKGGKMETDDV